MPRNGNAADSAYEQVANNHKSFEKYSGKDENNDRDTGEIQEIYLGIP